MARKSMVPAPKVTVVRVGRASPIRRRARQAVRVVSRGGRSIGRGIMSSVRPLAGGTFGGGVYALGSGLIPSGWHPALKVLVSGIATAAVSDVLHLPPSFVSGVAGAAAYEAVQQLRSRRATDAAKK